jgi:hypothetical protein
MFKGADVLRGHAMESIRLVDMRAKEVFQLRDVVEVIGTYMKGIIVEFDADMRLARVDTQGGLKWFYLKDLIKK